MKGYKSNNFLSRLNQCECFLYGFILPTALLYSSAGISALYGDSQWLIEKGDNVYSIARQVFPDDASKQRLFRKEVVKANPTVFNGNANHMGVGQRLVLPGFVVSKPVPVVTPVVVVAPMVEQVPKIDTIVESEPVKEVPMVVEEQVVAPDPEEVIGQVVISVGNMQANNRGSFRKLLRHSEILKGDTLTTSKRAYTQIRMKDGALISLRPNTKLKITDYRFNGTEDGSERSVMELVSGGFRTITGLIGHRNKQNYRVKTAVATIGIRGTHYGLMVCSEGSCSGESVSLEDGVYGGVVDGSIVVENDAGAFTFNNDQYFHVASQGQMPVEQLLPPPVFHGKNEQPAARNKNGEDRNESGKEGDRSNTSKNETSAENSEDKNSGRRERKIASKEGDNRNKRRVSKTNIHGSILGNLVKDSQPDTVPLLPPDRNKENTISAAPVIDPLSIFPKLPTGANVTLAPKGSGMLIAFTDISGPGAAAIPVLAGGKNAIGLVSGVDQATGTVINNLPVVVHEEGNGKVHDLLLPSGGSGVLDTGGNPVGVNWGRWSPGFKLAENGTALASSGDLHFVYSDKLTTLTQVDSLKQQALTDQLVSLGGINSQLTYNFAGGTAPTNAAGLAVAPAMLTVTADFMKSSINYNLVVSDTANNAFFDMQGVNPGGVINPTTGLGLVSFGNMAEFDLVPAVTCTGCKGRASAAFVGGLAQGVITTYSVQDAVNNSITGAAVLTRP